MRGGGIADFLASLLDPEPFAHALPLVFIFATLVCAVVYLTTSNTIKLMTWLYELDPEDVQKWKRVVMDPKRWRRVKSTKPATSVPAPEEALRRIEELESEVESLRSMKKTPQSSNPLEETEPFGPDQMAS